MIQIDKFEDKLGFKLPDVYRLFLKSKKYGSCKLGVIFLENGVEVYCDVLFGFCRSRELDLNFWFDEFCGEIPKNCVVIGSSPGGGFFLLRKATGMWEVMYYDHNYSFPSSSDDLNTYSTNISINDLLGFSGVGQFA